MDYACPDCKGRLIVTELHRKPAHQKNYKYKAICTKCIFLNYYDELNKLKKFTGN